MRFGSAFAVYFGDILRCISIQIHSDTQCEAEEVFLLRMNIFTEFSSITRDMEIVRQNTYMVITDSPPCMSKQCVTLIIVHYTVKWSYNYTW